MINDVLRAMESRRSHRAYAPTQLTKAQLDAILLAALQSPSAVNRQPWHFSVVQNQQLLARLTKAAHRRAAQLTREERGPRFDDPAFHVHYHAPTVIFLSAEDTPANRLDCGIAVQQIALAAESLGLGSVIVGLIRLAFENDEAEELKQALHFPKNHAFMISIALGTPTDDKPAHENDFSKISLIS